MNTSSESFNFDPEVTPMLLETVMRLTIDKVKMQRSQTQNQTPRPASDDIGDDNLSPKPQMVPSSPPRAKSTTLLRTLQIIQIGRKTSRLLTLLGQIDLSQTASVKAQDEPQSLVDSSPIETPSPQHGGVKRRSSSSSSSSSSEEESNVSDDGECCSPYSPDEEDGPSGHKSPCLETNLQSDSSSPESDGDLASPPPEYETGSCQVCPSCSLWAHQHPAQSMPAKFQLYEPVRQC